MKVLYPHFAKMPVFAAKFLEGGARHRAPSARQHRAGARLPRSGYRGRYALHGDGAAARPDAGGGDPRGASGWPVLPPAREHGTPWRCKSPKDSTGRIRTCLRSSTRTSSRTTSTCRPEEGSFESVVKVMDFGVAAAVGGEVQVGIGTPKYMAPEQVASEPLSPQTDQYALAPRHLPDADGSASVGGGQPPRCRRPRGVRRRVPPARPSQFCPWLSRAHRGGASQSLSEGPGGPSTPSTG